jgi:hypothetical protein
MTLIRRVFAFFYGLIVCLFFACALALIYFAVRELWQGVSGEVQSLRERFDSVLESIGLLTIAVAALELGQTILEEEVIREAHMSAPTRVRRFLSRFLVVVVVSLSIETLITVFQLSHANPALLPQAASIGATAALLLIGWAVFLRMNEKVERLEPEAMEAAKSEDHKMS